jgi:type II secretory pathway pseudopilin PulG
MRSDRRRGFMLLEALVALLAIGTVSAAALELFAAHVRAATRAPALVVATALAHERLTTIRLLHLERGMRLPDSLAQGTFEAPFTQYRWRSTIRYSAAALQDIQVRVDWPGATYALESRENVPSVSTMRGFSP